MKSQSTLIGEFKDGKKESGQASNMFYAGNTLYSYGIHFPLLIRMPHWKGFLLNADNYSSSTSRHQRMCFRVATLQLPFSALIPALARYDAGIRHLDGKARETMLKKLHILDTAEERWDTIGYYRYGEKGRENISVSQWDALPDDEKPLWHILSERRPQSAVLKFEDRFFLSSMDGWNYFISELPRSCSAVKSAFEMLKPDAAKEYGEKIVRRQGEWFFIPVKIRVPKSRVQKWQYLKNKPPRDGADHHRARDYVPIGTDIPYPLVRGGIYHRNRDHRTLHLYNQWHYAIESNHVMSWGANGRVD